MKKYTSKNGSQVKLANNGNFKLQVSKDDWLRIGKQAGWLAEAQRDYTPPELQNDYDQFFEEGRDPSDASQGTGELGSWLQRAASLSTEGEFSVPDTETAKSLISERADILYGLYLYFANFAEAGEEEASDYLVYLYLNKTGSEKNTREFQSNLEQLEIKAQQGLGSTHPSEAQEQVNSALST